MMQLNRLATQIQPGTTQPKKQVDIGRALHPQGMPAQVEAAVPQDIGIRIHPPELQPERVAMAEVKTDLAAALNPYNQPAPASAAPLEINFDALLNPPEFQPQPRPAIGHEPVNIRQILDTPQGRLAENHTGSLTFLD